MKSRFAVTVAVLAAALAAPTVAFAEPDSIDSETLQKIISQAAYDAAVAKRAAKIQQQTAAKPAGAPYHSPARDAEIRRTEEAASR